MFKNENQSQIFDASWFLWKGHSEIYCWCYTGGLFIRIPFIRELRHPTAAFEADWTVEMQKFACQTAVVLLSVSGSPRLLLALFPPCWRPTPLRIAAQLLAAAQLTVSSICFHSLGQDSLLCSSDTFSRRAAQCNYTARRGWFSELQLAPSISFNFSLLWVAVFLFSALFYEGSSFVWKVVIKKGLGFFSFFFCLFFFTGRFFVLLLV